MKKFVRLLVIALCTMALTITAAFSLTACGGNNKAVKIGVLVTDASGAEALAFRNYYENYVEKNYDVDFVYSEEIGDNTTKEMEELDKLLAENCKAIISLLPVIDLRKLQSAKKARFIMQSLPVRSAMKTMLLIKRKNIL